MKKLILLGVLMLALVSPTFSLAKTSKSVSQIDSKECKVARTNADKLSKKIDKVNKNLEKKVSKLQANKSKPKNQIENEVSKLREEFYMKY